MLLADLINWGWLRIGPPYIYVNINPIIFQIGPLALRWYGLMYVVGILAGLQAISGYLARKGISQEVLYRTLWWCIAAGLLGGRLYFVIQQHDLVQHYLLQPWHILATWEGGMAFYGAIFLVLAAVYWRARVEHINPLVYLDAAGLFASAGQIFGRIGNLINGDIIGYKSTLPWSTVYVNPNSWACNPYVIAGVCNTPVQPAAGYELLSNLVLLALMFYLARRLTRPGVLILVYLYSYSIIQFLLFFVRDNTIETPFGLDWGLKQAQWTSLAVFIVLLPITYWIFRTSKPVPAGELAASYGIPLRKLRPQSSVIADQATAEQDQETLFLEHDATIDPEDTQVILPSDEHSTIGSEDTQVLLPSDEHSTIGSEDTQVILPSDEPPISSEDTQVILPSDEPPISSEDTQVLLPSDEHSTIGSEDTQVILPSDEHSTIGSEDTQVILPSDEHSSSEDTQVILPSDEHSSSEDTQVILPADPDPIVSSDLTDLALDTDTSDASDTSEVPLDSDPDLSGMPDTPDVNLDPDTSDVSVTSDDDSDPNLSTAPDAADLGSNLDLSTTTGTSEVDPDSSENPGERGKAEKGAQNQIKGGKNQKKGRRKKPRE
jgi:phosphatidylglycerol:prolipoprotein diacylglycerol transferase